MPLLGPDGTAITTADPVVEAATYVLKDAGVGRFVCSKYGPEGVPPSHLATAVWVDQLGRVQFWDTAAGRTRAEAAYRLIVSVVGTDSQCSGCKKFVALDQGDEPWMERHFDPENSELCFMAYDPDMKRFRRACDGAAAGDG